MQYAHSNTEYYTKALYFQKSPLMEKNLLLQVILHRVNLILVLRNIKIAQNPNNSYPLNKPYLRLKTVKTISHTYLISKKRRTIFSKNIKPYVWLIRKWRVWERGSPPWTLLHDTQSPHRPSQKEITIHTQNFENNPISKMLQSIRW